MSNAKNTIIQVRARLQALGIKLWESPYYFEEVGMVETEIDRLADEFHTALSISKSECKCALTELQEGALHKLALRKEFSATGLATLKIRCIDSSADTTNIIEVKLSLSVPGNDLQAQIAEKLQLNNPEQVKCIAAGKIITGDLTLCAQGVCNNQQLMAFVGQTTDSKSQEAIYARVSRIKKDVEAIIDCDRRLMEMEDQDGNPVFLPPNENRSLLMGMGLSEKARAAMKREQYDEALLLLLEAEEMFNNCNSKFLDTVDNYALLNLDIVWCYLLLKNVSQLPDAQRRLDICERSFHRSYGKNFERLIALKGRSSPERALIMRLHLLQAVVYYHQNQRDDAYMRLMMASNELRELKINDEDLQTLIDMGYDPVEARLAMRSCAGNVAEAVQFIQDRKEKLAKTRAKTEKDRRFHQQFKENENDNENWVNPRSVRTLMDMGFERALVVEALKRCNDDVLAALDMIQLQGNELRESLTVTEHADDNIIAQLQQFGFDEGISRLALETNQNNLDMAIEFLIKFIENEDELVQIIERISSANLENMPSTSNGELGLSPNSLASRVLDKAKQEIAAYKAYERFNSDLNKTEHDYLDLPLIQEEQIIIEYQRMLEQ